MTTLSAFGSRGLYSLCAIFILFSSSVLADDDHDPSNKPDCHEWDSYSRSWIPYPNETCMPSDLVAPTPTSDDFPYDKTEYWTEEIFNMYGFWVGFEEWKAVASGTRNVKCDYRLCETTIRDLGCGAPLNISVTLESSQYSVGVTVGWKALSLGYTYTFPRVSETIQIFDRPSQPCVRYFGKYAILEKNVTIRLYGNIKEYKKDFNTGDWLLQSGPHPFDTSSDSGWKVDGARSSFCSARCSS